MKRPSVPSLVLSTAGIMLVSGFWLCAGGSEPGQDRASDAVAATGPPRALPPAVTIDASIVRESNARVLVDLAGVLEAVRSVVVGAEVGGRVVEVHAREHEFVEAGAVLARLDVALTEAAAERARASLLSAEAAHRLAQAELRRQRDLANRGVASMAELERVESEDHITSAQVAEARAQLSDARTRIDKAEISAPFAGVVNWLDLEPGAYLRPGDRVAEILDLSEIEIVVGVSDRQILALHDGDEATVLVDVLPDHPFEGRIVRPGRAPDPDTRKYPVPVRVPNPDAELLPGMLGAVRIELGEDRPALHIPRRAIVREFELDYLYLLEPEASGGDIAVARQTRVTTRSVPFRPDLREVTLGVAVGDMIATSGLRELRDGLRVRVRRRVEPTP